jgi:DNA-binding LytR/AlgR family response regulator
MDNYKIVIVEDEPNIADSLKDILEALEHTVLNVFDNGKEVLEYLHTTTPDLILLDIQIKGDMDGIEVARHIAEKDNQPFIFTTAFADEETIKKATAYSPYGYIVKPYGMKDIYAAIEIAMNNHKLIGELKNVTPEPTMVTNNHLFLKVDTRLVKVKEEEIFYVEAKGDYVLFKTAEKGHIVHSTMKKVEEKLNPARFLKVHRSFIINLDHVVDIEDNSLVINGKVIPVSRSNKDVLLSRINTF